MVTTDPARLLMYTDVAPSEQLGDLPTRPLTIAAVTFTHVDGSVDLRQIREVPRDERIAYALALANSIRDGLIHELRVVAVVGQKPQIAGVGAEVLRYLERSGTTISDGKVRLPSGTTLSEGRALAFAWYALMAAELSGLLAKEGAHRSVDEVVIALDPLPGDQPNHGQMSGLEFFMAATKIPPALKLWRKSRTDHNVRLNVAYLGIEGGSDSKAVKRKPGPVLADNMAASVRRGLQEPSEHDDLRSAMAGIFLAAHEAGRGHLAAGDRIAL